MQFVESKKFTEWLKANVNDDEYQSFQKDLIAEPDKGDLIVGTGGLRKARMGYAGAGKRDAGRVIYYWVTASNRIHLLMGYGKGVQVTLTPKQKKVLKAVVDQLD